MFEKCLKSYTFDGSSATKWHNGPEAYGKRWKGMVRMYAIEFRIIQGVP